MFDRKKFFDEIRPEFFSKGLTQEQTDGIDDIFDAWDKYGDKDGRKLAYLFATDYHETATHIEGVDEYGHGAGHAARTCLRPARRRGGSEPAAVAYTGGEILAL